MIADLTPRDKGELLSLNPPLRNFDTAARLKRYWHEGRTAKHAGIIVGVSKSHAKKFYMCFSRALRSPNAPPLLVFENRKRALSGSKIGEKTKTEKGMKNDKALIVNFSTPLGGNGQTGQHPEAVGEGIWPYKIPLTRGLSAFVDEADFVELSRHKWSAKRGRGTWYAVRRVGRTQVRMHREIMGLKAGDARQVDHADGDGLNCRRENLRLCTVAQNQANRGATKGSTSGFKGVFREAGKWRAKIGFEGRSLHVGMFGTKEEAAAAYNGAAARLHGEFNRLNEV